MISPHDIGLRTGQSVQAFAQACFENSPAAVCLSTRGTFRGQVASVWLENVRFVAYGSRPVPFYVSRPNPQVEAWMVGRIVDEATLAASHTNATPIRYNHLTPDQPFRSCLTGQAITRARLVHYHRSHGIRFLHAFGAS